MSIPKVLVFFLSIVLIAAAPTVPEFRWAQRKDRLFLTIDVQGCVDDVVSFEDEGKFFFKGNGFPHDRAALHEYQLDLQFLKPINSTNSTCTVGPRDVQCTVEKKVKERYWKRLLLSKSKMPTMTIDWSKWLDEEKDGVKWNNMADRKWEWWKEDEEEDDD